MLGAKLCPKGEFSFEGFGVRKTFLIQKEHPLSATALGTDTPPKGGGLEK